MITEETDMTTEVTIITEEDSTITTEETDTDKREAETATDPVTGTTGATRRMTRRPVPSLSRRSRWTGGSLERVLWLKRVQEDMRIRHKGLAKSLGSSKAPSSRSFKKTFSLRPLTAPASRPLAPPPG